MPINGKFYKKAGDKMKKSASVESRRYIRLIEKFYGSLGFFGIYFICCSAICPFAAIINKALSFAVSAILLAVMAGGFLLQAAWCRIRGYGKNQSSKSYESLVKFYDSRVAAPLLVPAAALGVLAAKIGDAQLKSYGMQQGNYYDEDSIAPALIAAAVIAVFMLGSFIWFFPYDRLLTGKGVFVGFAVTLVSAALYFTFGNFTSAPVALSAIYLFGYGFCVLLAYNQTAMHNTYHGDVSEFLTPRTRVYNMSLALLLVLAFLLVCGLFFVIAKGFSTLVFLLIVAALAGTGHKNEYEDVDLGERTASISSTVFNTRTPSHSADYWLMLAFIAMFVAGLVLFIFRRRKGIKSLISSLKRWIYALFDSIFGPIGYFLELRVSEDEDDGFLNFVDEEEKLQNAVIREYGQRDIRHRSWRDFQAGLKGCAGDGEKYRYAYSEFVRLYRKNIVSAKKSDTPREIAGKYARCARYGSEYMEKAAENFEKIEYGGMEPDANSGESLRGLLEIIKETIDT